MAPLEHIRSPRIYTSVSIIVFFLPWAFHLRSHLGAGAAKNLLCSGRAAGPGRGRLWRGTGVCDTGSTCMGWWEGRSQ